MPNAGSIPARPDFLTDNSYYTTHLHLMSNRIISLDYETPYAKGEHDIRTMGQRAYVRDPRTKPYLISVHDGANTWAGHPRDFNFAALEGGTLLSHNRAFDELVHQVNFPESNNYKDWHCTASLTTYLCMRRDLLRASEFLLGELVDKSYRDDADGQSWEQMVAAGKAEKVKQAGRVDAVRCYQFWAKFGHLWPERERQISDLTIRQCRRGAQINRPLLDSYLVIAQTALIQAEAALPWMARGGKPTSPKAIAEECRTVNIPPPPVKSRDGEEAYDQWAATYGPQHRWVKAFTDYRVINKFISTLETIKARLDGDNVFAYELLYFGAHTGRWSGSGGFNMQNQRKDPLFIDREGWLITDEALLRGIADFYGEQEKKKIHPSDRTAPDFVGHVLDIRRLFTARPGRKLIPSDLSQIEPRCLAWLVGDKVMLDSMASGQSPYEAHARATMGWTGGDMKKESKPLYALAKARVLGLGYGCGWRKFITVAQVMAGLDITKDDPEFVEVVNAEGNVVYENKAGELVPKMESGYGSTSKKIVKDYRDSNPLVVGLWKKLDDAFRASEGSDFIITLPSGRQLRYPAVKRELKMVPDPDKPGVMKRKQVFTALAFDQTRNAVVRQSFYGGLLVENLVQAFARDVFVEHCLTLDKTPGVDVLWSVHDEAVNECELRITKHDIELLMGQCPDWCKGLPVAAEAIETPHYLK